MSKSKLLTDIEEMEQLQKELEQSLKKLEESLNACNNLSAIDVIGLSILAFAMLVLLPMIFGYLNQ